jgi:hypothetical protein
MALRVAGGIPAIRGAGALHKRLQSIVETGRLVVGPRGIGLASQTESLNEPEMRVSIMRGGLQRGTEGTDGGRSVVPSQCQSATEFGQGRVIVARGVRVKQRLRTEDVAPVEGNQGSGSEDLGVGWRQQIQVRFRLVQTAQSPEALGQCELQRSVAWVGTDSSFQFFGLLGSVNRLVPGERTATGPGNLASASKPALGPERRSPRNGPAEHKA